MSLAWDRRRRAVRAPALPALARASWRRRVTPSDIFLFCSKKRTLYLAKQTAPTTPPPFFQKIAHVDPFSAACHVSLQPLFSVSVPFASLLRLIFRGCRFLSRGRISGALFSICKCDLVFDSADTQVDPVRTTHHRPPGHPNIILAPLPPLLVYCVRSPYSAPHHFYPG